MLQRQRARSAAVTTSSVSGQRLAEVGILTRGKPTLGMTLSSLLLQDSPDLRIHIVDTCDTPVVNRDDVTLAMRLAFDREIPCSYERLREKKRGFSLGRLKLLEALRGPHVCFVDDDMALSAGVIGRLLATALRHHAYGCVRPTCYQATVPLGADPATLQYTPGSLLHLDDALRRVLSQYYEETTDVVDAQKSTDKVWEVAFLGDILNRMGRACLSEPQAVVYHLDHHELSGWSLSDQSILRRTAAFARRLACETEAKPLAVC